MKNVLIILYFGVIISVIQAAFEPIPFNPKFDNYSNNNNQIIKLTGINYTPYNFKSLKYNQLISKINVKSNSIIFDAVQFGDNIYNETSYSLHFKSNKNSIYQTIIGLNHYQLNLKNYGSAKLNTIDIGIHNHLIKNLSSTILFQNILKDKSGQLKDEINTNIRVFLRDNISSNLSINYQINRINAEFINHSLILKYSPKHLSLSIGFETLTRQILVSFFLKTKYLAIFTNGVIHPELGISNMVGFEITY